MKEDSKFKYEVSTATSRFRLELLIFEVDENVILKQGKFLYVKCFDASPSSSPYKCIEDNGLYIKLENIKEIVEKLVLFLN